MPKYNITIHIHKLIFHKIFLENVQNKVIHIWDDGDLIVMYTKTHDSMSINTT